MRLARIRTDDGAVSGRYDDGVVTADGEEYEVGVDAELLAPCEPTALYCVGRNYAATVDQMDYDIPDQPDWFIKPPVSVLEPGADIEYPDWTDELTYAGELAAVIDRECSDVSEADVGDVVRGYTILNDLDALDQPGRTARKAFDGSGPLGPWIETDVEPSNIDMTTHVGGELRQEANTERMLFSPAEVVSFLSERYTFQPGDVISFGSPANPGLVEPGDDVEIWYEGVGTLTNRVVDGE
ncbi:fumarylacetoacetate hydrolase family protein [Haloferax sulfurifontis]|uniref:2-hydroxyhepta-2,4-diene-1, 7-dioate isomerase n=1 Tax=Haloferax sulfurifontis ATCC BAA-897 TaxID=662480 RepID=M0I2A7_9EURY|nr:fumarylacetoacetate hydrolase family protein [Haloferax sulfurifontis]ELZ90072.1 2-hydroxyhepta-2,4-diene-1, 7-dioate isomerase [Haloferax sulfurifontis ATCC BAA-897]